MIPDDRYGEIIEVLPILCVDVIIRNERGEYLLIRRSNEPMKGRWWIIGGRVLKGESLEDAARRLLREEVSLGVDHVTPIGYYEAVAQENPLGLPSRFHAVSVVFGAVIPNDPQVHLDFQSTGWQFSKELPADLLIRYFDRSLTK